MSKFKLFILFFLFCSPSISFSAALVKPSISGLSGGYYKVAANDVHYANGAYSATGLASLGAYQLTLGAAIPIAANAAQIALSSARANPYALGGSLLLAYLLSTGILDPSTTFGVWEKSQTDTAPVSGKYWLVGYLNPTCYAIGSDCSYSSAQAAAVTEFSKSNPNSSNFSWDAATGSGSSWTAIMHYDQFYAGVLSHYSRSFSFTSYGTAPLTVAPMTDADWSALSLPSSVNAELPYASYMPNGVPVGDPVYQSGDYPLSDPYANPDGSSSQERAKVTPASGGQVNVETYSQPVTDTSGQPVTNPTPTTTDTQQTECQQHPETLGCLDAGTDTYAMPTKAFSFTYTPEASPIGDGTCPAPIIVLGQTISYQSTCDAMGMIKPLVLAIASLMAAYILLGAFRGGD